jgi:hypothetical protein
MAQVAMRRRWRKIMGLWEGRCWVGEVVEREKEEERCKSEE